ncbi:hypothetical protein TNCV_4836361 [Trichonephila clavipes]|nr:hypothetical protein TNCV_4836361 [Trichonephila clavipes]
MVAHSVKWLATLTAVPLGLDSNLGEDMDVCKYIVPSRHEPSSRKSTREGGGRGRGVGIPSTTQGVLPKN